MHHPKRSRAVWFLASCLAVLAVSRLAAAQVELGLHAALDCAACHEVLADGTPVQPPRLLAEAEPLCGTCHQLAVLHGLSNHPSGIVPARPLPAGFPLDGQGRMTCTTCHRMHGTGESLLRGDSWNCASCHDM